MTLSFVWRRRLVRQRMSTARLSRSSLSASSSSLPPRRSRSSSNFAISSSRVSVLLRLTSVGWAVRTGLTSARSKKSASAFGSTPISRRALKGVSERAGARRGAGDRMGAVAADVMLIFGDIGEMREIAVGANDRERLVSVEAVERRLEFAPRADLVVAMEANRGLADLLDQLENLFALLLAHGVAEDSTEQTDVLAQGNVLLVRRARGQLLEFGGHGHRRIRWLERRSMLHCVKYRRKAGCLMGTPGEVGVASFAPSERLAMIGRRLLTFERRAAPY